MGPSAATATDPFLGFLRVLREGRRPLRGEPDPLGMVAGWSWNHRARLRRFAEGAEEWESW